MINKSYSAYQEKKHFENILQDHDNLKMKTNTIVSDWCKTYVLRYLIVSLLTYVAGVTSSATYLLVACVGLKNYVQIF